MPSQSARNFILLARIDHVALGEPYSKCFGIDLAVKINGPVMKEAERS